MNEPSYLNWIHLDFKGMVPSELRLCQWLEWIRERGFSAVVFEYEDRIPWETFPGTYRKGFDLPAWKRIWKCCERLGLEVIPLIQTFGHLEWLLKHERWSHLRCSGHVNLLCPEHPEVRPLLEAWVNEVARLHPESPYIHVGLDEIYHMGACAACQSRAAAGSPHVDQEVLRNHATFVCEAVIRSGKRPIIWADMFLGHGEADLAARLPSEVIVCDWKYKTGVGEGIDRLAAGQKRDVMGASAIRCSFPSYYYLVDHLQARIDNVSHWHQVAAERKDGAIKAVIHTVWARSRGLAPLYGPWEGWLPAFEIAANPWKPLSAPIQAGMALLEQGMNTGQHHQIEEASLQLHDLHSEEPFEEQALRWWKLSLRYYAELHVLLYRVLGNEELRTAIAYQGPDPDLVSGMDAVRNHLVVRLDSLEKDVRSYLQDNQWSDWEEYMEGRVGILRSVLNSDSKSCDSSLTGSQPLNSIK